MNPSEHSTTKPQPTKTALSAADQRRALLVLCALSILAFIIFTEALTFVFAILSGLLGRDAGLFISGAAIGGVLVHVLIPKSKQ